VGAAETADKGRGLQHVDGRGVEAPQMQQRLLPWYFGSALAKMDGERQTRS
jgi:hypothetical protein